jgi:CheY-like chemotaxis protein
MLDDSLVILLAEDDEGHASLVQRNLRRAGIANTIHHVADGKAALDFARYEGVFADRARGVPLLILLDINMPRLDGIETLRRLKADDETKRIPVIMLTTTDEPREIARCYDLGCGVYITKPVEYERFVEAIRQLGLFLQVVQIPQVLAGA